MIIALSLAFEHFYKRFRNPEIKHYTEIVIVLFIGCLIPLFIFLQKDFGTMLILLSIFIILFLTSPILKKEKLATIAGTSILIVVGCIILYAVNGYILTSTQLGRFTFWNPCERYETGGYQICNGFIAINEGGLFGVGIGKSTQKLSYVPFPHTDSVFAIFIEEQGLLGATIVLIAYLYIIKRIIKISSEASTIRGKYMALGIAVYMFMHIVINLGGLFGLIPLTGVPLPFFSWGGTFMICMMGSLAIVQRINIETKNKKITIKEMI
jgi:cell division protein FtsW